MGVDCPGSREISVDVLSTGRCFHTEKNKYLPLCAGPGTLKVTAAVENGPDYFLWALKLDCGLI
jgi:hypothetical protein